MQRMTSLAALFTFRRPVGLYVCGRKSLLHGNKGIFAIVAPACLFLRRLPLCKENGLLLPSHPGSGAIPVSL
ncbi:MAG: hypothetical protein IPN64_12155 [Propionivibrio sp.]|nr:hypothetical protein [Propionivibrio sp.]